MNTNPLMPCGVEQKNQGRARVKIAVFFVLAVHVIVLGALLMQGCKREEEKQPTETTGAPVIEPTNAPPVLPPPIVPPIGAPLNPIPDNAHIEAPVAGVTEYTIVKGDSFYSIAKKFHTTMKAIQDANPGLEPTKLQPAQKIKIPAPAPTPTLQSPAAGASADASVYEVKSGDTLSLIAQKNHTTVKALRAANNLTTDKIKVGQKLKIPVIAPAPVETVPAPAPAAPAPAGTVPIK